jgi:DNA-binding transcriptional MerR regulator
VDPPAPFKYFSRKILESTGSLAMSVALRQIENAFVQALARDYANWACDGDYRRQRASMGNADVISTTAISVSEEISTTTTITDPSSGKDVISMVEEQQEQSVVELGTNSKVIAANTISTTNNSIAAAASTLSPRISKGSFISDELCLLPGEDPEVRIEVAPQNARRIYSAVDIRAPLESVWAVLTNYEGLGKLVPSLLKNEVLSRDESGGARLLQIGGAKVLPGITFKARTVLDVKLHPEDNPLTDTQLHPINVARETLPLRRDIFPRPFADTSERHRDITMQNVQNEGDFDHYQGVWRIQSLPQCVYDDDRPATRLSYAVELRPKGFLPVNLIEGRIAKDLRTNLDAIRKYLETQQAETIKNSIIRNDVENITVSSDELAGASTSMPTSATDNVKTLTQEELYLDNQKLRKRIEVLEAQLEKIRSILQNGS